MLPLDHCDLHVLDQTVYDSFWVTMSELYIGHSSNADVRFCFRS